MAQGSTLLFLFVTALVVYIVRSYFQNGLHKVPGPILRAVSPIVRIISCWQWESHLHDYELHKKYGKIVRVAPNTVSVSDPEEINNIYNISATFPISRFYDPFRVYDEEGLVPDPLVITDKAWHRRIKSGAAHAYSLSTNVKLEPFFDEVLEKFLGTLEEYAEKGEEADMTVLVQSFAMDNILRMTLGRDFDFLRDESQRPLLKSLDDSLIYLTLVGQIPWIHNLLWGNPYYQKYILGKDTILEKIFEWSAEEMSEAKKTANETDGPQTFLQQLIAKQNNKSSSITDREVATNVYLNITAGSDTTATAIRAVLIQLLNNPEAYTKAIQEVRSTSSTPMIPFSTASKLPYLNAVIRESMRLHPSVQMLLARSVPAEGAEVCGIHLNGGVEIGINPYIVHRDPDVFEDPEEFRPERWLTEDKEALARMNRAFFAFGAGQHTCSGKHIAALGYVKSVAALLWKYDLEYAEGVKVWNQNMFIAPQRGLRLKVRMAREG